eukprot:CAMPEP_0185620188 /NCGR_PEP_ID=MMETSP0436-20130131/53195_1 /TAXON_ID=626734 ORGANISM="Favella taraikaensis, Strain Fe Narragansett Bay" /NCGR_SAMPLE_ID=MMETSP0436 /ASSEMBLY_ACC=CAM_ASM_000390 /LENGTH=44 /DNA_ID= /DNA_START= /DNA_END= /DNA_ORIENTATION=
MAIKVQDGGSERTTTNKARPPSTIAHKRAKTTLQMKEPEIKKVI